MGNVDKLVEGLTNIEIFVDDTIEDIKDVSLNEAEASHWHDAGEEMAQTLAQVRRLLTAS